MNKHHSKILKEIKNNAEKKSKEEKAWVKKYMGTDKAFYCIKSDIKKKIAKDWIKENKDIFISDYRELLSGLFDGKSHEEIAIAAKILEFTPKLRKKLEPKIIDKWLNNSKGWGEVDSICQSNFSAEEILNNWTRWRGLIIGLSKDKNIHKRRASLVLLTKSARTSNDERIKSLSYKIIDTLKKERDILITKAVSWLLRSLAEQNPKKVRVYLENNKDVLPKIAIRETSRKILTGKK